jgi:DNA helicase-2/ATP-dependent DNA helicase PcrA
MTEAHDTQAALPLEIDAEEIAAEQPAHENPTPGRDESASSTLNAAQREAVEAEGGALLILAGPGSGKTRVIAHRIAHLVLERGVPPSRILAVTFTNKAAQEMRDRVEALIGARARALTLGTFHSVCARILRRDGQRVGVPPEFAIYDTDDQRALVRRIQRELQIDPRQFPPRAVLSSISTAKNERIDAASYAHAVGSYHEEIVARVYERYEHALRQSGAVDFDDLLLLAGRLFDEHPETRQAYAERYLHVLVDEFQDTNLVQYRLARQLASVHGNITAVGDPDQSIYSWRAADVRNLQHFQRDFRGTRLVLLEQNYRSTGRILRAAHAVISRAEGRPEKALWTENAEGERIGLWEFADGDDEGQAIAAEVRRLLREQGRRPSEIAVMYRTNAQSRAIEEAFVEGGVRYRIVGGTRFYDRREVRDLLAYLRLVQNESDSMAFQRVANVPARGIGPRTIETVLAAASELGVSPLAVAARVARGDSDAALPQPRADIRRALGGFVEVVDGLQRARDALHVAGLLEAILAATRYRDELTRLEDDDPARAEARWENVQELLAVATQYEELEEGASLSSFLEEVALVADVDDPDSEVPDAVTLTTLHAAKGLEYPIVFLAGLEEGVLPHLRALDDPPQLEEERRLLYVGMTRAQERLYLLHARRRFQHGAYRAHPASRFLAEIPSTDLTKPARGRLGAPTRAEGWAAARERRASLGGRVGGHWSGGEQGDAGTETPAEPAFAPGERVVHGSFGEGVVVSCETLPGDQQVTVAFEGLGVKRLLLSYAPLSRA